MEEAEDSHSYTAIWDSTKGLIEGVGKRWKKQKIATAILRFGIVPK